MGDFYTHATASLIVAGLLTFFLALSGKKKPHQLAFIFLIGLSSGIFIDLDHFLWGRIYFGDWKMLTGCLFDPITCLSSPADVWANQYGTMPSVAIKIRNAVHIFSTIAGTGLALLIGFVKPNWSGKYALAMVVLTTMTVHVMIDTASIWKPLLMG